MNNARVLTKTLKRHYKGMRIGPSLAFKNPATIIASGFGSGLAPWASGTFGTAFGVGLYLLLEALGINAWQGLILAVLFFAIGVPACTRAGIDFGKSDHGAIVWDEIVAILVVLYGAAPAMHEVLNHEGWLLSVLGSWLPSFMIALCFVLFRFFDIIKPWPARWVDATWHHGFGVMLDDIVAALYSLLCLYIMVFIYLRL